MKTKLLLLIFLLLLFHNLTAQVKYRMKIDVPVFDYPQNIDLPYKYPSMNQALEWSTDFYELGFRGIDELGDLIFKPEKNSSALKKFGNNLFKYAAGLAFSKYGSELPIPLGVWAHEEFHRSVAGTKDIRLKNGNWIFDRWDGTVYGVSDQTLAMLKTNDPDNLLYSYLAGIQYEILSNERSTLSDFYFERTFPKGPLLLYNAYYVWDYFRFSSGSASDSAKILAPPHEDINPEGRDFTGADLNAWIYDMFNPQQPYTDRDPFPGGTGVNRRIGYSDLPAEGQEYLKKQKNLSLLNFLNPSILQIDRIKISDNFSFNFFTRYSPVHFGNEIAIFIPFKFNNTGYLFNLHRYSNRSLNGYGIGLGMMNLKLWDNIYMDLQANVWDQPRSFYSNSKKQGGSFSMRTGYNFSDNFSAYVNLTGKTSGWLIGNPYLGNNISVSTGIRYDLFED